MMAAESSEAAATTVSSTATSIWLTTAVARAFNQPASSVVLLGDELVGVDSGGGLLSYRRRVTLSCVAGSASSQQCSSGDRELALYAKYTDNRRSDMQRYYQAMSYEVSKQECAFYGFLLPVMRCVVAGDRLCSVVPRCHLHCAGPHTTLLVMDDLLGRQGYSPAGRRLSLAQLRAVLAGFGRLQAAYWLARSQLNFDLDKHVFAGGGTPIANPLSQSGLQVSTLVDNMPSLLNTLGKLPGVTADDVAMVKCYLEGRFVSTCETQLLADLTNWESLGLVHGDLWYPNLMLSDSCSTEDGEAAAKIIDWQFCGVGKFGRDFGTLLLTSADTDVLVGSWEQLMGHFYEAFAAAYKAAAGTDEAPVRLEAVRENCMESLAGAVLWLLWDPRPDVVAGCYANLLAMLRHLPMQ